MLKLYTVKEAAVYLGVTVRTIYNYIEDDVLPVYRFHDERKAFGRPATWHVSKEDLDMLADIRRDHKSNSAYTRYGAQNLYSPSDMYDMFDENYDDDCDVKLLYAEFGDLADRIKTEDKF